MKKYLSMIIGWAVIIFFASTTFSMFIAFMTLSLVLIYLIVWLYKLVRKRISLQEVVIKISIILISYILIGVIELVRAEHAQKNGNIAVERIKQYKAKNGTYPASLSEINLDESGFGPGVLSYRKDEEKVTLFYFSTAMIYATYNYDFKENKWEYFED